MAKLEPCPQNASAPGRAGRRPGIAAQHSAAPEMIRLRGLCGFLVLRDVRLGGEQAFQVPGIAVADADLAPANRASKMRPREKAAGANGSWATRRAARWRSARLVPIGSSFKGCSFGPPPPHRSATSLPDGSREQTLESNRLVRSPSGRKASQSEVGGSLRVVGQYHRLIGRRLCGCRA
jgi:hypothetical protein